MNCKNCNAELESNAKFCGKCGQQVITETKMASGKLHKTDTKSNLKSIGSFLVLILAIGVGRYLTQGAFSSSPSTSELITQSVNQVKSTTTFPSKLDEVTTWVNIEAEPDAIRYDYILSNADTSKLSNAYLKSYLATSACQNESTKNLLDHGINMEYSYVVENTTESYFVTLTKTDCSQ